MGRTEKIRVMRIITRLNIGGPAIQAITLSGSGAGDRFVSLLVTGRVAQGEREMSCLLSKHGVRPVRIDNLSRTPHPLRDLAAWIRLLRLMFSFRPQVVHTHTAKAGALGRSAGIFYRFLTGRRVRLIHTYHGHVFSAYFGPLLTRCCLAIERLLARGTDKLAVLSPQQFREICRHYRVGREEQFVVLPLGLELSAYLRNDNKGDFRSRYAINEHERVLGIIGRMTAVKNQRLFLEAARRLVDRGGQSWRFVLVGDGELRGDLEGQARRLGLESRVVFTGWKRNLQEVYPALDIVALTSRNEGTPVVLIEALAAGRPIIATAVGGVGDLLGATQWRGEGFAVAERGLLVTPDDVSGLVKGIEWLADKREEEVRMIARGRDFVRNFSLERLARDIEGLYSSLVSTTAKANNKGEAGHASINNRGSGVYRLSSGGRVVKEKL